MCEACRPAPSAALRFSLGGLRVWGLGPYEGSLRRAVLALKGGRRDVGALLGALLAERWGTALPQDALLVAVPTSGARKHARGFDQASLLTQELARHTGLEFAPLVGRKGSAAQQGRSRSERLHARGRFVCVSEARLTRRPLVLVDDVLTTGGTLSDCAGVLRAAGGLVGGALVVARTCIASPEHGVLGIASNEELVMPKAVWNNTVIADSDRTEVVEGNHYFPRDSVNDAYLRESQTRTVCPWKGIASYYSVVVDERENKDAAWFYPEPKVAAANIKDRIAFWRGVKVEP